ncbi:MAG: hypothetical protein LBL66_10745 [Clostridiales bacterium]|jgi:hypothetical protein|nr:hypothetical protein [Clostridiales bacterium]
MEKEKPKNAKKEFTVCLLIGLTCVIVATACLLVFYRPFVKWQKLDFSVTGDVVLGFKYDGYEAAYHYKIDGIEYYKVLKGVGDSQYDSAGDTHSERILYINTADPNDVKRGSLGGPMLGLTIGFIATGGLLIWFGFHQKKRIEEENKKNAKKEQII